MNTHLDTHVPFAQTPIEGRVAFFILSMVAMAHHRGWPPTPDEIGEDLERIWNEHQLRFSDLQDEDRLIDLLVVHLAKYASRAASPRRHSKFRTENRLKTRHRH
jgi:hypothetical protein